MDRQTQTPNPRSGKNQQTKQEEEKNAPKIQRLHSQSPDDKKENNADAQEQTEKLEDKVPMSSVYSERILCFCGLESYIGTAGSTSRFSGQTYASCPKISKRSRASRCRFWALVCGCNVAATASTFISDEGDEIEIFECHRCGFFFEDPVPLNGFASVAPSTSVTQVEIV